MQKMNIWLDDVRPAPLGWIHTTSHFETNMYLTTLGYNGSGVGTLSLDHDLGLVDDKGIYPGTGYDVVLTIEESAARGEWRFVPDKILIHSANPVGRAKMEAGIAAIKKMRKNFQNKG